MVSYRIYENLLVIKFQSSSLDSQPNSASPKAKAISSSKMSLVNMHFLLKKTALCILCLSLSFLPSHSAPKMNNIEISPLNINGSIIDQSKNTIIILKAKKLNLQKEVILKNKDSKEKYNLSGIFTANGDLEINLIDIGFEELLKSSSFTIAATDGRKKYANKFSYIAPIIVRGFIEIPTKTKEVNLSNANISIHDPLTKKRFNEINTIVSKGEIKTTLVNSKPFSRLIYPLFAEIPGSLKKKQNIFEVRAEFLTSVHNQNKLISLSTYIDLKNLLNKNHNILQDIKLSTSTSIAVNLTSSTLDELKKNFGNGSHIPEFYELYLNLSRIFSDADVGIDAQNSMEKVKYILSDEKEKLFAYIVNFINDSKYITNQTDAVKIASDIYFKPNIISNEKERNNSESIYFDEIVKSIEKNSKESDSSIIKSLF